MKETMAKSISKKAGENYNRKVFYSPVAGGVWLICKGKDCTDSVSIAFSKDELNSGEWQGTPFSYYHLEANGRPSKAFKNWIRAQVMEC